MQWNGAYGPHGTIDRDRSYTNASRHNARTGRWQEYTPRNRDHRAWEDTYPWRAGPLDGGTYGGYAPDASGRLGNFTEIFPGFMTTDDYFGARYGQGGIGGVGSLVPGRNGLSYRAMPSEWAMAEFPYGEPHVPGFPGWHEADRGGKFLGSTTYSPDTGYSRPTEGRRRHREHGESALRNMQAQLMENDGGGVLMDLGGGYGVDFDPYAKDVDMFGDLVDYDAYMGSGRY